MDLTGRAMRASSAGMLGLVIGVCAGLLAGGVLAGASVRPVPQIALSTAPRARSDDCLARVRQLESEIAASNVAVDPTALTPASFPPGLPLDHLPVGVRYNADRAARECADMGLVILDIDCGDYPCIVSYSLDRGDTIDDCPTWLEIYQNASGVWATRHIATAQGVRVVRSRGHAPGGFRFTEQQAIATTARVNDAATRIAEGWGGQLLDPVGVPP